MLFGPSVTQAADKDHPTKTSGKATQANTKPKQAKTTAKAKSHAGNQSIGKSGRKTNSKANPKEELSSIHARIESLQKQLETTQEAHADVSDALKESEKSISDTNRKLFELNQRNKENRNTLAGLQQQKSGLESTIQKQKQLIAAQFYRQYVHGEQNYVRVVMQEQQPGAMARQLQYYTYIYRARLKLIDAMHHNLGAVIQLNDQTAQTLKQISTLKTEQEKQRITLQSEKNERNQVLQKLSTQMSAQRNEIEKLKRDEKSLSELVERLSRALAAKTVKPRKSRNAATDHAEDNTPQVEPNHKNTPIARNETLPSNAFEGGDFASLRGKLNLPVRGEVTNRFGEAREDTGISWKGLFIKANEGNEVKSVASGRVVFADWMRGFGNLLIIDHGDGYMSLYGNNQGLLRKVGDTVKAGDTIASVGNSGGNEVAGLYYELRKQSRPFDPLSWSVIR